MGDVAAGLIARLDLGGTAGPGGPSRQTDCSTSSDGLFLLSAPVPERHR